MWHKAIWKEHPVRVGDKRFHLFSKIINPKVNAIALLEFELTYNDVAVHHVSHDATKTSRLFLFIYIYIYKYIYMCVCVCVPLRSLKLRLPGLLGIYTFVSFLATLLACIYLFSPNYTLNSNTQRKKKVIHHITNGCLSWAFVLRCLVSLV